MSRRYAMSGASGFIGRALAQALEARGDRVLRLVRRAAASDDEVRWDWKEGRLETAKLEGLDGFVHLAGAPIATRWTPATMREIRESRTKGTQSIVEGLVGLERRPGVLVSASAIGFYGDGRERSIDDDTSRGEGWLADLCEAWELSALPAAKAGIRVTSPRIGLVMNPAGGALRTMLTPFRMGVGGKLGDGKQGMSWIGLNDMVRVLLFALDNPEVTGPFNATAPNPVSNAEFTRALARAVGRWVFLPVPEFMVGLIWGEMGRRLMLDGDFIRPSRLGTLGFEFEQPTIEASLRHELAPG